MRLRYLKDFPLKERLLLRSSAKLRTYIGLANFEIKELAEENERLKKCIKINGYWISNDTHIK